MKTGDTKLQSWSRQSREGLYRLGRVRFVALLVLVQLSIVPISSLLFMVFWSYEVDLGQLGAQLGRAALLGLGLGLYFYEKRRTQPIDDAEKGVTS